MRPITTRAPMEQGRPAPRSDGQALAALGAACVDDGAATAGLHANEKAVGTGAADFGCLVGAFHDGSCWSPTSRVFAFAFFALALTLRAGLGGLAPDRRP